MQKKAQKCQLSIHYHPGTEETTHMDKAVPKTIQQIKRGRKEKYDVAPVRFFQLREKG